MRPEQVVFAVSPLADGGLDILLGVSKDAWKYMQDGRCHTFDLTKLGLPIRILMFGCADHQKALDYIQAHNASVGVFETEDKRGEDFTIRGGEPR
jgi:hypothetical protein